MGNEANLNNFNCVCFQNQEGCFFNFLNDINSKDPFNFNIKREKLSQSELQENTPGGIHYPNDNMVKSALKKKEKRNQKINNLKYEPKNEKNIITKNSLNNIKIKNDSDNEEGKEKDIKDFDKKSNYYLLANQINNVINELKANLYVNEDNKNITPKTPSNENKFIKDNKNLNFENIFKKIGKKSDKIIFKDIINCIKKISDIHSEIILNQEKIYLGIVNKFKKEKNDNFLINYEDEEKIIDLPNFEDIKENDRLKLGKKLNNPKFQFNKFTIKGSFPNEILIWNLISKNTQRFVDILSENYYCCIV